MLGLYVKCLPYSTFSEPGHGITSVSNTAFHAMWTLALVLNYTEEMRLKNVSRDNAEFDSYHHLDGEW